MALYVIIVKCICRQRTTGDTKVRQGMSRALESPRSAFQRQQTEERSHRPDRRARCWRDATTHNAAAAASDIVTMLPNPVPRMTILRELAAVSLHSDSDPCSWKLLISVVVADCSPTAKCDREFHVGSEIGPGDHGGEGEGECSQLWETGEVLQKWRKFDRAWPRPWRAWPSTRWACPWGLLQASLGWPFHRLGPARENLP